MDLENQKEFHAESNLNDEISGISTVIPGLECTIQNIVSYLLGS